MFIDDHYKKMYKEMQAKNIALNEAKKINVSGIKRANPYSLLEAVAMQALDMPLDSQTSKLLGLLAESDVMTDEILSKAKMQVKKSNKPDYQALVDYLYSPTSLEKDTFAFGKALVKLNIDVALVFLSTKEISVRYEAMKVMMNPKLIKKTTIFNQGDTTELELKGILMQGAF